MPRRDRPWEAFGRTSGAAAQACNAARSRRPIGFDFIEWTSMLSSVYVCAGRGSGDYFFFVRQRIGVLTPVLFVFEGVAVSAMEDGTEISMRRLSYFLVMGSRS